MDMDGGQRWHRPFQWWPSARMMKLRFFKRWGSAVRARTLFEGTVVFE